MDAICKDFVGYPDLQTVVDFGVSPLAIPDGFGLLSQVLDVVLTTAGPLCI